jgi:hypothetical protein
MPTRFFGSVLITGVLVVPLLIGGVMAMQPVRPQPPGEPVPTIAAQEVFRGKNHGVYSSTPPTSGWFVDHDLRDGFYTASITDEEIVGALHAGKVAIAYNCQYGTQAYYPSRAPTPSPVPAKKAVKKQSPQESQDTFRLIQEQNTSCGAIIEGLRALVQQTGQQNIILFPYNKMQTRIALLSWGRMEQLVWLDEKAVEEFIETYRKK